MDNELEAVKIAVKTAGRVVLDYYLGLEKNKIEDKIRNGDVSPVTLADLAAEKVILNELEHFGYGVLSEETTKDDSRLEKRLVWIIDPLDGTMDFIQQTGEFSVLIALAEAGQPVLGAIYQPSEDKMYYAVKGRGAWLERGGDRPVDLRVSAKTNFATMSMLVSRNHLLEADVNFAKSLGITKLITCGSAGLKIGKICEQAADLYLNTSNKTGEWDIAAAQIILTEAGGSLTDMHGREIIYNKSNPINLDGFLATNGLVHDQAISQLRKLI